MTTSRLAFRSFLAAVAFLGATTAISTSESGSVGVSSTAEAQRRHLARCIQKVQPTWSDTCEDGFHVQLVNRCDEPVRVHWCVRQNDGDLHCGVHPSLAPGAASNAQACNAANPAEVIFEACSAGESCRVRR
ncbi:MAG: hypothetical protein H6722_18050 [Sandaracinus sp.]|nr:hypothetical protein [Sandaracinus sp.]